MTPEKKKVGRKLCEDAQMALDLGLSYRQIVRAGGAKKLKLLDESIIRLLLRLPSLEDQPDAH